MPPIRLALVCDYLEEGWPSMDLVGDMILDHLRSGQSGAVAVQRVRPPFRHRLARLAPGRIVGAARNADRLWNRFVAYPNDLRRLAGRGGYDAYHVVDHSYAQVVHALPPGRAVVTCHDLDTFRCLLQPHLEPRPRWFRVMARRILTGMQKAAAVACVSEATRSEILAHDLIPEKRLHLVSNGISPEYTDRVDPARDSEVETLLGPVGPADLLHVGSTIPRKRIDLLLEVFAAVRSARPDARLIRVGGPLTPEQAARADALGVTGAITRVSGLDRDCLAAVYRRATLLLQPSEAEGFGLPVAEALACGTAVLASDLPVLREVGGLVATYRPVGDIAAWADAVLAVLAERRDRPADWNAHRAAGIAHAAGFRWDAHVARLMPLYRAAAGLGA